MKTLTCDKCDETAEGETFEDWMKALMPHYMAAHADFMEVQGKKPADEQQQEQAKWMTANKSRFDKA